MTWRSTHSIHPVTMRQQNLATVLKVILAHGPIPRADITEIAGTSSGTTTKLTAALIEAGIVKELTASGPTAGAGRPRVPLDLDTASRAVLTLHIGVHYSLVAAVDIRAEQILQRKVEHRSADAREVIQRAAGALAELRRQLGGRLVIGVGITSGGTVDHTAGRLMHHADLGWTSVPVRDLVAEQLGLEVVYDNEARGEALAELTFGVGSRADNVIALFVGSVVEAAIVVDRRIHRGAHGVAGTVTHLPVGEARGPRCECGRRNCLRMVASNTGLLTIAREQGIATESTTYEELVERSAGGDDAVAELLALRARWVGEAVGVLTDLLDPDAVTLSGNATHAEGFLDAVRTGMRSADPTRPDEVVQLATFGEQSTAAAAAALLLDRYFADPVAFEPGLDTNHGG
ncbi:ROK family protein [Jiangella aurantiaca]|nr:ROK family protein [Jiangella aurantiaca]